MRSNTIIHWFIVKKNYLICTSIGHEVNHNDQLLYKTNNIVRVYAIGWIQFTYQTPWIFIYLYLNSYTMFLFVCICRYICDLCKCSFSLFILFLLSLWFCWGKVWCIHSWEANVYYRNDICSRAIWYNISAIFYLSPCFIIPPLNIYHLQMHQCHCSKLGSDLNALML